MKGQVNTGGEPHGCGGSMIVCAVAGLSAGDHWLVWDMRTEKPIRALRGAAEL